MKIRSIYLVFPLLFFVWLGSAPFLHADDERPSVDEVLEFLGEKMPESMELLERVRVEEGVQEYAEVLESAGDLLEEYLEIQREEGDEIADLFLEEERNMIRMRALAEEWHEEEGEEDKEALEGEIVELIGAQIDRDLERGWRELESLEAEVEEFRRELTEIEKNREIIIAEELEGLLFEEDREDDEWEEDEEDEEEQDDEEDGEEEVEEDEDER